MAQTILHCINSFSSRAGGVGFALKAFCDNLTEFDHVVFALRDDQPLLGANVAALRIFDRTGPFSLSYSRGLEKALCSLVMERPDVVVHVHGLWSGLGHSVNAARRLRADLRYVVSPHGMLAPEALKRRRWQKQIMRTLWEGAVLRHAIAIHCLTSAEEHAVRAFDSRLATFTQPHAIEFPLTDAQAATVWQDRLTAPKTLLYLGRIHETKGVIQLVDALSARSAAGRSTGFRLRIAGIGAPDAVAALKARVAASPADVEFVGPAFGTDKARLFREAHGLILPSKTEGLPMTLLEAAACGLALYVTHECNLDWVEPEGAGVAMPYGMPGIEGLITAFEESSLIHLAAMGRRALGAARKRCHRNVIAQNWQSIYTSR